MSITVRGLQLLWRSFNRNLTFVFDLNYFLRRWLIRDYSTRQGVSFCWKSKAKLIPWAVAQNINKMLKVSRLLATSLEILVTNTQFSVALATSWSQFRTLLQILTKLKIPCRHAVVVVMCRVNITSLSGMHSAEDRIFAWGFIDWKPGRF